MGDFSNKTVIVTGGASGLGKASALKFAAGGANVAVLDVDEKNGLATAKAIEQTDSAGLYVPCDVTDEPQVEKAIAKVVDSFGSIDVAHINAGIIDKVKFVSDIPLEDWARIVAINLTGAFLCAKHTIKQMLRQSGGNIVFTGSNWVYVCDPGFSSYAATKGGVVAFARALALDHAKDNIRINVVCPGNMSTPLLERQLSEEKDPQATLSAMGQISTPEEVANLVAFLASDESSAMKGSAVIIDQGETLGYGPGLGPTTRR